MTEITAAQMASLDQTRKDMDRAAELKTKVATTEQICTINKRSVEKNYNRSFLQDDLEDLLDPDGWHVIKPIMFHHHSMGVEVPEHLRCQALLKVRGGLDPEMLIIDMSIEDYE